jgi:bifunctional DNase/RNase
MKRKELKILGLSYSQTQVGSYICVLSEIKGERKIPIIVKTNEAQKIALELEGIESHKVFAHDIIKSIADSFELDVREVEIYSLTEGIFYTRLIISNGIDELQIESSIGDALAIAVMFKCPIFCVEEILKSVGIHINDDGSYSSPEKSEEETDEFDELVDELDDFEVEDKRVVPVDDLEKLMQSAIENEEYEIAAELRDRIQSIKEKK